MYLDVEVASESNLNVWTVQSLEYQFLDIFLIKLVNSEVFHLI